MIRPPPGGVPPICFGLWNPPTHPTFSFSSSYVAPPSLFYWKKNHPPPPPKTKKTAFHNLAYPSLLNSSVRLIDFSKYGGNDLHFPNVKIIADGISISINSNIRSNIKKKSYSYNWRRNNIIYYLYACACRNRQQHKTNIHAKDSTLLVVEFLGHKLHTLQHPTSASLYMYLCFNVPKKTF